MNDNNSSSTDELTSINGVGPTVQWDLECAEFMTVEDVARADVDELASVKGIGEVRAQQLITEAAEMVELENDMSEHIPSGDNAHLVGFYANEDEFPEALEELEHPNDTEPGTPLREALLEGIEMVDEAVEESGLRPGKVTACPHERYEVAVKGWALSQRRVEHEYNPTFHPMNADEGRDESQLSYPTWDDHLKVTEEEAKWLSTDDRDVAPGEVVRVRQEGEDNYSLTTLGWILTFRKTEKRLASISSHIVQMTQMKYSFRMERWFDGDSSRGDYIKTEEEVSEQMAGEALGADIDETEQKANVDYWDVADDALTADEYGHSGPMDTSDDRTELNQTSGSNSTYTVNDNPGGGEGSASYTTK